MSSRVSPVFRIFLVPQNRTFSCTTGCGVVHGSHAESPFRGENMGYPAPPWCERFSCHPMSPRLFQPEKKSRTTPQPGPSPSPVLFGHLLNLTSEAMKTDTSEDVGSGVGPKKDPSGSSLPENPPLLRPASTLGLPVALSSSVENERTTRRGSG